jgi:hypothetical protein
MNQLLKIMYAATAAVEQAAIVWETMSQAERLALEPPSQVRQIGFKTNGNEGLQERSTSPLDPKRFVPTLKA